MDKNSLEYKLKFKLRSGQIDQEEYDELRIKFEKLGLLQKLEIQTHRVVVEGSKTVNEIDVTGPVFFSGGVTVDGLVSCKTLSSSGSVNILGTLLVKNTTSISGELNVDGEVKLLGPTTVTGTLRVNDSLICGHKISVTGNLFTNDVLTDEKINIIGKFYAQNIKSAAELNITGTITSSQIIAEEFNFKTQVIKSDKSYISGKIKSKIISIEAPLKNFSLKLDKLKNLKIDLKNSTINKLVQNTVDVFVPEILSGIDDITNELFKGLSDFTEFMAIGMIIDGDIICNQLKLSHVQVNGDIYSDIIEIGSNVIIFGTIYYKNSITIPKNMDYIVIKIE